MAAEDSSIEDPTYDPSFEKEHGAFVGEKEREREATEEEEAERVEGLEEDDGNKETKDEEIKDKIDGSDNATEQMEKPMDKSISSGPYPLPTSSDPLPVKIQKISQILNKDGPYYPQIPNCTNPYRDGYITTPPKNKPPTSSSNAPTALPSNNATRAPLWGVL
mmetsp:Transcript_43762/g.53006  ORF Transcript_43762/g.53006 Transcript_43762/m.53006 type:complete len:163 (+) Transcript_43762:3-491(+)